MRLIALPVMFLIAACATVGPAEYGPADEDGFGYAEQKIEDDRYRVIYRGSGGMPPELVEDYALRRASELALENGYDWFRVAGRALEGEERGGVSVGTGFGTSSYGRRSSVGVGVGADLGRVGSRDFFTARMEVTFGRGEKPEDGEVYDARDVAQSIGGPAPYRFEDE